ncbi:NINE protein, partial [Salmonella sp. s51228]|uniref:NINE protein n=1 Tax=Salmonella sp. s51228 TaxID=3159652 RepID=UPI00397FE433
INRKNKVKAVLLSIFLGGVGAANFYLEEYGLATAQLLLTLISWCSVIFFTCWDLFIYTKLESYKFRNRRLRSKHRDELILCSFISSICCLIIVLL